MQRTSPIHFMLSIPIDLFNRQLYYEQLQEIYTTIWRTESSKPFQNTSLDGFICSLCFAIFLNKLVVLGKCPYRKNVSILGVGNHAILVEHTANSLLWPVPIVLL